MSKNKVLHEIDHIAGLLSQNKKNFDRIEIMLCELLLSNTQDQMSNAKSEEKPSIVNIIRYFGKGDRKITFAININYSTHMICFGWSDSGNDQFSKVIGRKIAYERLVNNPLCVQFVKDIDSSGVVYKILCALFGDIVAEEVMTDEENEKMDKIGKVLRKHYNSRSA